MSVLSFMHYIWIHTGNGSNGSTIVLVSGDLYLCHIPIIWCCVCVCLVFRLLGALSCVQIMLCHH